MTTRSGLRVAVALLACTLVAGCAGLGARSGAPPADLTQVNSWQARGRLGVSGGESGGSGSFDWRQRGDHADVRIRGPVGVGGVRLELRGDAARPLLKLETSDGQKFAADAAWEQLELRLGAQLPAGQLRYWMLGLAAPGEHRWLPETDEERRTLEQSGWRIDYQRFAMEAGLRVPVRMRAASGDARVRIVVDRWRLGQ